MWACLFVMVREVMSSVFECSVYTESVDIQLQRVHQGWKEDQNTVSEYCHFKEILFTLLHVFYKLSYFADSNE